MLFLELARLLASLLFISIIRQIQGGKNGDKNRLCSKISNQLSTPNQLFYEKVSCFANVHIGKTWSGPCPLCDYMSRNNLNNLCTGSARVHVCHCFQIGSVGLKFSPCIHRKNWPSSLTDIEYQNNLKILGRGSPQNHASQISIMRLWEYDKIPPRI